MDTNQIHKILENERRKLDRQVDAVEATKAHIKILQERLEQEEKSKK